MLWKRPMFSRARCAVVGDHTQPRFSRRFHLATAIALTLGLSAKSSAAILLSWNTVGNAGTETSEPSVSNDANLSAASLTLGAGVTAAANTNRFGGSNWFDTGDASPPTLANSISGNDYIQFIVTPVGGASYTPTSFQFTWDFSNSGPSAVALRSSVDGFAANLGQLTGLTAGTNPASLNTITISGLTNLTAATTFRLYGFGTGSSAASSGGTAGFDTNTGATSPNVILNGTTVVPAPAITPSVGSTAFGNLLLGAVATKTVTLTNSGTATMTSYTANASGDITANPTSATGLNVATGSSISTAQVVLDTSTAGNKTGSVTYTPGPGGSASSALNFTANVGNAAYATGDSSIAYGTLLTAPFSNVNNTSANLSSTTTGSAGGSSPVPAVSGSTATILRYDNTGGGSETIGMQWRTRTAFEANYAANPNALLSDVVNLTGMTSGSETSETGTGTFVLQMSYMSDADLALIGLNESSIASSGELRLGWLDGGVWQTAVQGNKGTFTPTFYNAAYNSSLHSALGSYGVDTSTNTVWAVLNHNSEFAVIPEPSCFAAAGLAMLGLTAFGLRRRRSV